MRKSGSSASVPMSTMKAPMAASSEGLATATCVKSEYVARPKSGATVGIDAVM